MSQKVSTFAKRLREALDERGITQATLAQISGISKSSISRYLSGAWEGKQDAVYALSKSLNVNEAWLMGYDVLKDRDIKHSDNLEQAENIYKANGVGVNLFDEPMGFDSSAVPTLVKEAMKKQTLSVEDVAKKASIKPEILQKLLSGQNYTLALYQLSALSFVLKIPFDDMVKVDADGSVSAKAFKNITEKFREADNSGSSLSEKEKQALKLEYTEKLTQIMAESFSNIMAFGSSVLPEFSDYVENSEEDQAKNVLHQMDELLRIIEKVNDQDVEREIMARVNSIIKIVSGYSAK